MIYAGETELELFITNKFPDDPDKVGSYQDGRIVVKVPGRTTREILLVIAHELLHCLSENYTTFLSHEAIYKVENALRLFLLQNDGGQNGQT